MTQQQSQGGEESVPAGVWNRMRNHGEELFKGTVESHLSRIRELLLNGEYANALEAISGLRELAQYCEDEQRMRDEERELETSL